MDNSKNNDKNEYDDDNDKKKSEEEDGAGENNNNNNDDDENENENVVVLKNNNKNKKEEEQDQISDDDAVNNINNNNKNNINKMKVSSIENNSDDDDDKKTTDDDKKKKNDSGGSTTRNTHKNKNIVYYFNNAGQARCSNEVNQVGCDMILNQSPDEQNRIAANAQIHIRHLFAKLINAPSAAAAAATSYNTNNNNNNNNTAAATSTTKAATNTNSTSTTITADGTDIAIVPSTAFAMTLAAQNIERELLALQQQQQQQQQEEEQQEEEEEMTEETAPPPSKNKKKKKKILVLQDQFDSVIYPLQRLCRSNNNNNNDETSLLDISFKIVKYPKLTNSKNWTEAILKTINEVHVDNDDDDVHDEEIILACLPPVHWSDGTIIDLIAISKVLHTHKIRFIVDATQGVGILPNIDVQQIQPDMLCCSVHKWLRCPSGICLMYVHKKLHHHWVPLDIHGRSRDFTNTIYKNVLRFDATQYTLKENATTAGYPSTFFHDARKFDSGGKPNPILLPMIYQSLQHIVVHSTFNMNQMQSQLQTLTKPIFEWAKLNNFDVGIIEEEQEQEEDDEKDHDAAKTVEHEQQQESKTDDDDDNNIAETTTTPHTTTTVPVPVPIRSYHIIGIRPPPTDVYSWTVDEMLSACDLLRTKYNVHIAVRCGAFRISPYIDNTPNDIQHLIDALDIVLNTPEARSAVLRRRRRSSQLQEDGTGSTSGSCIIL